MIDDNVLKTNLLQLKEDIEKRLATIPPNLNDEELAIFLMYYMLLKKGNDE